MEEVNSGDIIVITKLKSQGKTVGMHSFVVLSSENGTLCGIDYDFIALMMSSFKDADQKSRKLSYPGNFEITSNDEKISDGHGLDGYIKAEQFYLFDENAIEYKTIGKLTAETFETLLEFIKGFKDKGIEIELISDNTK